MGGEYTMVDKSMLAKQFIKDVRALAQNYDLNFFIVTDGASAISNTGNSAVEHARKCHVAWELENGIDPNHDWSKE